MKERHENFFRNVYDIVRLIPKGRVTTYGAIANYLGTKSSARMVGWAMNASFNKGDVPAHRVVNRVGILTGKNHFQNSHIMQELLESEGVKVMEDRVVEFDTVFWDPAKELEF